MADPVLQPEESKALAAEKKSMIDWEARNRLNALAEAEERNGNNSKGKLLRDQASELQRNSLSEKRIADSNGRTQDDKDAAEAYKKSDEFKNEVQARVDAATRRVDEDLAKESRRGGNREGGKGNRRDGGGNGDGDGRNPDGKGSNPDSKPPRRRFGANEPNGDDVPTVSLAALGSMEPPVVAASSAKSAARVV